MKSIAIHKSHMTGEEAGPILRHAVEIVADGAPWQHEHT
jgi:hypothetical protein